MKKSDKMRRYFVLIQRTKLIRRRTIFLATFLLICLLFLANKVIAATPPLLPFDNTGDLYVLDFASDNILRVTPAGVVTVAVTKAAILAATGEADVSLSNSGIAFDASGDMYFTEGLSDSILKREPGGAVSVLTSKAAIMAETGEVGADPDGVAFGSDGFLYVTDDLCDCVLRVNPTTGAVTVHVTEAQLEALGGITDVDIERGIVGDEAGNIYVASDGTPNAIFKITAGGTPSVLASNGGTFKDLQEFMTRAPNGDLIVSDSSPGDMIHRVTPAGTVSTFLSEAQLEAATCVGQDVDLKGGIAFDDLGNFYVAEENTDTIYKFNTSLQCSVFVDKAAIQAVTGVAPNLTVGIAFVPRTVLPSMDDNSRGNAALAYWQASPDGLSTLIMIQNTEYGMVCDKYIKYRIRAECSTNELSDGCIHLAPGDSIPLWIRVSGENLILTNVEVGTDIATIATGVTSEMRGYVEFTCWDTDCCSGLAGNAMAVSTALMGEGWVIGVNAAIVQDWADTGANICAVDDEELPTYSQYWGRYYSDGTTLGRLITIFPGQFDVSCQSSLSGSGWNESGDNELYNLMLKDVASTPIGPYEGISPSINIPTGATSGAIEITGLTKPMFGFVLMPNPSIGNADALPLFR